MITIILAAGASSRFNSFKPLFEINGKAMIEHIIDALNENDQIGIVTGHKERELKVALGHRENLFFLSNPNYQTGLSSSVEIAIDFAKEAEEDLLITLADLPFIQADDYRKLKKTFRGNPVFSQFGKDYGPPCIIPQSKFSDIEKLTGDRGLKTVFDKFDLVEIENASKDIDEPNDLKNF